MSQLIPTMDFKIVGLRFQPTDEEIVDHYLKNKLLGNHFMVNNVIAEIDVCKFEPFELPKKSLIKSDDQWYFFCPRDYKYPKSTRLNRATKCGFWKATGADRSVKIKGTNTIIGSKKTLVFYEGKSLPGVKTNWVIHEYHAVLFGESQRTFVLCRLMKKPEKNAERGNDSLTFDEGDPSCLNIGSHFENQATVEGTLDAVDGLPKMNMESTFEAPPQLAQCFPHSTNELGSSTNSPFLGAYFNNEKNNMQTQLETIQEENESVDPFMYSRDENITFQSPFEITPQEQEWVNSFLVDFDFGINVAEERENASLIGPTQSDSSTMFSNERTDMNVEVASALGDHILDASTVPHEHPSTWEFHASKMSKSSHSAMHHGSTSVLSSNKDKQESISQYDMMGMGTSSCDSTSDKPLEINCNETLSSASHSRPQRAARRRPQTKRKASTHMGWPKNL